MQTSTQLHAVVVLWVVAPGKSQHSPRGVKAIFHKAWAAGVCGRDVAVTCFEPGLGQKAPCWMVDG